MFGMTQRRVRIRRAGRQGRPTDGRKSHETQYTNHRRHCRGGRTRSVVPYGATANAQTDPLDSALGSVTSGSFSIGGAIGSGEATGSLPGQCSALDPKFASLGIGMQNNTTAVLGELPGTPRSSWSRSLPQRAPLKHTTR